MSRRSQNGAGAKPSAGKRSVSSRLGFAVAIAASAWGMLAANASAAPVTVGSPLPAGMASGGLAQIFTLANSALPEAGAQVTSPIDGTIVRWRITQATGGPFKLRVLRPGAGGAYTAVGTSKAMFPSGTATQTFATNLPIHTGDLIGLDTSNLTDKIGQAFPAGSKTIAWAPPLAEGATLAPTNSQASLEIGFNADVQPPPGIASIFPTSGPTTGGTSVTISGHDFAEVLSVKFGATPAASFTIQSETQMTVVSPAVTARGAVDISVTTAAGTTGASPADQFTYTACVVPKLKGKKLKADRKILAKAGCKLGKVKGKKSKTAKVKKQSAKPGTVLPVGSKVNVKLGG